MLRYIGICLLLVLVLGCGSLTSWMNSPAPEKVAQDMQTVAAVTESIPFPHSGLVGIVIGGMATLLLVASRVFKKQEKK